MKDDSGQLVFSIVIPARDMETYIEETLESVRVQTEKGFEVIVVDDGSTDGTATLVNAFIARWNEKRFRLIQGPERGVSAARNAASNQADSRFVLFLDADDLLVPDALARFRHTLEKTGAMAALGGVQRISEDGTYMPSPDNRDLVPATDHLHGLLCKNFIVNGGALAIRTDALKVAGNFDETLRYGEDWEFWCRLTALRDLAVVDGKPVLQYRQRGGGANYLAKGSVFAKKPDCLKRIADNPAIQKRFGSALRGLLRARQIDIFWSGVRSEFQFGSKAKAMMAGLLGLVIYPDSVLRPQLALRFFKSLKG